MISILLPIILDKTFKFLSNYGNYFGGPLFYPAGAEPKIMMTITATTGTSYCVCAQVGHNYIFKKENIILPAVDLCIND